MFSKAARLFTILGFDVELDPSWVIIAVLITWSLATHAFPDFIPGLAYGTYLAMAFVAMLGFFGSLLLHELAHCVVARRHGVEIERITLFIFGGVAQMTNEPPSASIEFRIAIAGPLMSFALAAMFWTLAGILVASGAAASIVEVAAYLALMNLVLAIFNLVPAFPLDGGRVLRAFIWARTGDVLKATQVAARSGTIFASLLMALGALMLIQGQQASGLWQLLIGGFILLAARSSYQQELFKSAFKGKIVSEFMTRNPKAVNPDTSLSDVLETTMLRDRVSFVPVVEDDVLLGHVDIDILNGVDRQDWSSRKVGDVYAGLSEHSVVAADLSARDLMDRMAQSGRRKFLVADGHHLLGVITLSDLMDYLSLVQTIKVPQGSSTTPHLQ